MALHIARAARPLAGHRLAVALLVALPFALSLAAAAPASQGWASSSAGAPVRLQQLPSGRNDQGDVSFLPELSAGFEGISKAGHWLTVRAVVANEGPPLDGELRLSMRTGGEIVVYTQRIEIASKARKLATFQIPGSVGIPDLKLSLRANEVDVVTRDVPLRTLTPTEFLVGVMTDDGLVPTGLASVRRGGNPVVVARLAPTDLPTDPLPFQALDALVIRQAASDRLTPEQRTALRTWVEQGGQLVVAGGPGWRRSVEGLDELLPVFGLWTRSLRHVRSFSHYAGAAPPDGDVLVTIGSPIDGARVLLIQESIPLLVERWLGLGRVTFIGVDPAIEPFRSWPAAESLWQRVLVGGRPGLPTLDETSLGSYPLRSALSEMLNLGLPAPGWVIGFLVGYVVVAGPVQYFVLRRLDRREWAWVGFPAVAFLAAGLLIGSAWWLRGPDVHLASISMVRVVDDVKIAPVDTYIGLVSPTRGTYDLAFLDGLTPRPIGDSGSSAPIVVAPGLPGTGGAPTELPALRLEGRAPQSFQWRSTIPSPAPILSNLKTANGRLEGTIRNTGSERLEDVFLVAAGEGIGLGDLAAGDTRPVSISLPTSRAAGAWQNGPPPWTTSTVASSRGGSGSGSDRRRGLVALLTQPSRGSDGEASGGALLLAWAPATPPRLKLGEATVAGSARQLIEQSLPIDYGREDVTIPPGLLSRMVLDGAALSRGGGTAFVARGPMVFQFDLPPALELARIDRLSVHLAVPAGGRSSTPRVSLYRWADRTWVDVPLSGTGVANLTFGGSFVDGGAIRLRLEPQGNDLSVDQLDLSLDGVRQ
jgi:hypothetical protein